MTELARYIDRTAASAFHRMRVRKALGIPTEWGLLRYALVVRMGEEHSRGA